MTKYIQKNIKNKTYNHNYHIYFIIIIFIFLLKAHKNVNIYFTLEIIKVAYRTFLWIAF